MSKLFVFLFHRKQFVHKQLCKPYLLLILLTLSSFTLSAQSIKVKGIVVEEKSNEPVIGALITLKGENSTISSTKNGEFELTVKKLPVTIKISILGFKPQEYDIYDATERIVVALTEDVNRLDAVVVVGYGTQKRNEVTGAVTSLNASELNKGSIIAVDQLIAGHAAGVQVTQGSGEPGSGVSIRIRGTNSINAGNEPLYVIDGLPIDNSSVLATSSIVSEKSSRNPLNALNPSDVESIEILKDASATAIYGSRGANGVILVTTKKGSQGKLKVGFNSSYSVQNVAKKIPMLSSSQYIRLLNDLNAEEGKAAEFTDDEIAAIGNGIDWQDEIFKTGTTKNNQVSISGGKDNLNFYTSLNYLDQQGVIISSGLKRYNGQFNLGYKDKKFKLNANLNTSRIEDDFVPNGVSINESAGIVNTAVFQDPTLAKFKADGLTYAQSSEVNLENPLGLAYSVDDIGVSNRTYGNVKGEYNFLPELSVAVNLGSDIQSTKRDTYISTNTKRGAAAGGIAKSQVINANNFLAEFTTNYNKDFDKHHLNILGGYTYQSFGNDFLTAGANYFSTDAFLYNNLSAGSNTTYSVGTSKNKNQLLSYLARGNYSYANKYFLTATLRADGSSRFGSENKWGYFPSISVGWELKEEDFLKELNQINSLKLRTSYGHTGNQEIGNNRSSVLLGTQGNAIYNGALAVGISTTQLANPNLKWETTKQFDLGLDYSVFSSRISGSVDYYSKNTSDLLLELPVPYTTGFTSTLSNVGSTRNSGFEFLLNTLNVERKNFSWKTSFNISTVNNKVVSLGNIPYILQGSAGFFTNFSILKPGEDLNSYYGYDIVGIVQQGETYDKQPLSKPGEYKYRDANGDGVINTNDITILGSPFPDFNYGINNELTYKNLTLSLFIQGSQGGELLNLNISESENPISYRRNRLARSYTDRWTPQNQTKLNNSGHTPTSPYVDLSGSINSRAVQDASYIRLKSLQLNYKLPLKKVNAQVFVSGQNLLTITKYLGYDPDVSSYGSSNLRADYNSYPTSKIYTLGLNLNF